MLADRHCVKTNTRNFDELGASLKERLLAVTEYLRYESQACHSYEQWVNSHMLRTHQLHVSDWGLHYFEHWTPDRF